MQFLLRPGPSDGSKCVSLHYIIAGLLPSHDASFEVIYLGELGYVDIFGNSLLLLGDDLAAVVTHRAAGTKTH